MPSEPSPELIVEERDGYRFAALVKAGRMIDLAVDRIGEPCRYRSIWLVTIDRVSPHIGAFADMGKQSGLFRDGKRTSGDRVTAQVKSLRSEGKADILTDDISFGGNYFVYLPLAGKITLSRRIEAENAAEVVKALNAAGIRGGILRATALNAPLETIVAEARALRHRWLWIERQAGSAKEGMLEEGPHAADRLAHDYPQHHLVPVNDSFEARGIAEQLEALTRSEARLAKGGSIVIEKTSALTAIDVNAGTRSPATVDREALARIAGEIRLRNLSGLIVIDFAASASKDKPAMLVESVRRALADDPAGCRVAGATPSGLIEITRPARDLPLADRLGRKPTTLPAIP